MSCFLYFGSKEAPRILESYTKFGLMIFRKGQALRLTEKVVMSQYMPPLNYQLIQPPALICWKCKVPRSVDLDAEGLLFCEACFEYFKMQPLSWSLLGLAYIKNAECAYVDVLFFPKVKVNRSRGEGVIEYRAHSRLLRLERELFAFCQSRYSWRAPFRA